MKKYLILFTLLLAAGLSAMAAEFEVGDLRYTTNSDAELTVEVYGYVGEPETVIIPEAVEYDGVKYTVTSVGRIAFLACTSLVSVTIPETVTSVGEYSFASCWSLGSVTIPNSVTSIGYSTFSDCESLTSVTISNSVIYI